MADELSNELDGIEVHHHHHHHPCTPHASDAAHHRIIHPPHHAVALQTEEVAVDSLRTSALKGGEPHDRLQAALLFKMMTTPALDQFWK